MPTFIVEKRKPFDRMSKNNDGTVDHITGVQTERVIVEGPDIVYAKQYAMIHYPHLYRWTGKEYTVIYEERD